MNAKIKDGGPAFPASGPTYGLNGMSLRDYFAAQILPVIASDLAKANLQEKATGIPELAARGAYIYADAMLASRSVSS